MSTSEIRTLFDVYRDEGRWSVPADDLPGAVAAAALSIRFRSYGELRAGVPQEMYVGAGKSFDEGVPLPELADETRVAYVGTQCMGTVTVTAVYRLGAFTVARRGVEELSLSDVVDTLLAAATRVEQALKTPVHYVRTYARSKRAGQPKFRATDDAAARAKMVEDHAANERRKVVIGDARWCVFETLDVLPLFDARDVEDVSVETLALLKKIAASAYDSDGDHVGGPALKWIDEAAKHQAKQAAVKAHVEATGFGEGVRCFVKPSKHADDPLHEGGEAVVLKVHVDDENRSVYVTGRGDFDVHVSQLRMDCPT